MLTSQEAIAEIVKSGTLDEKAATKMVGRIDEVVETLIDKKTGNIVYFQFADSDMKRRPPLLKFVCPTHGYVKCDDGLVRYMVAEECSGGEEQFRKGMQNTTESCCMLFVDRCGSDCSKRCVRTAYTSARDEDKLVTRRIYASAGAALDNVVRNCYNNIKALNEQLVEINSEIKENVERLNWYMIDVIRVARDNAITEADVEHEHEIAELRKEIARLKAEPANGKNAAPKPGKKLLVSKSDMKKIGSVANNKSEAGKK